MQPTNYVVFRRHVNVLAASLMLLGSAIDPTFANNPLTVDVRAAKSGEKYSFVFINNSPVSLVESEPDRNDTKNLMSLPIAFVGVDGKIVGVFVHDGKVDGSVSKRLGGVVKVQNGRFEILDTASSAPLTKPYLDDAAKSGGALVQQFLIVKKGKPCQFKDKGLAQRRGIGKLRDGKELVIESKGKITLAKFADDLVSLGVQDLLYSDLGAWGQSWMRDPKSGTIVKLANEKSLTENHTNWLLVSESKD